VEQSKGYSQIAEDRTPDRLIQQTPSTAAFCKPCIKPHNSLFSLSMIMPGFLKLRKKTHGRYSARTIPVMRNSLKIYQGQRDMSMESTNLSRAELEQDHSSLISSPLSSGGGRQSPSFLPTRQQQVSFLPCFPRRGLIQQPFLSVLPATRFPGHPSRGQRI
jgi:hypothetical protein